MCKLRKPIYLIIECHTDVAYCRETDYATALEILHRLNDAEGANRYCLQACYYQEVRYENQTILTYLVDNKHRRTDPYYNRFIHHFSLHNHNSFVGYCDFILFQLIKGGN